MPVRYLLTEYVERAMAHAVYDKLEDGTYAGRISPCPGVTALAPNLRECEEQLQAVLEEWILLGLRLQHPLPVLGDLDLNAVSTRE